MAGARMEESTSSVVPAGECGTPHTLAESGRGHCTRRPPSTRPIAPAHRDTDAKGHQVPGVCLGPAGAWAGPAMWGVCLGGRTCRRTWRAHDSVHPLLLFAPPSPPLLSLVAAHVQRAAVDPGVLGFAFAICDDEAGVNLVLVVLHGAPAKVRVICSLEEDVKVVGPPWRGLAPRRGGGASLRPPQPAPR